MKKINVGIVNYGMGNIKSIENSLLYLGCRFKVLSNPDKISSYSHLILPGVGSFKKAIENLKINGLHQAIQECANNKGINLLGICLGMQLLCESSSEGGFTKGLSLIKNKVETFTQKEIGNIQGIKENSTAGNYASAMRFSTRANGATPLEQMRIDSSGNVGIGTTAPDAKLMIQGGAWNTSLKIKGAGATSGIIFVDSDNNIDGSIYASSSSIGFLDSGSDWTIQCKNDDYIRFATNGSTEHMRITSIGDVGIGVVPIAVNTSHDSLQIGGNANIQSYGTKGAGGEVDFCHNVYFAQDGNYKLISADEGTLYRQGGGKHEYYAWASGSAGGVVSVISAAKILSIFL